MSVLSIMHPLGVQLVPGQSSAGVGLANLLTPNPREPFVAAAAGATTIALDLGVDREVDTVFLGHTNAAVADGFAVRIGATGAALIHAGGFAHSYRRAPVLRHAVAVLPAPIVTRHLRLVATTAAPLVAGIVAVGLSLRPGRINDPQSGHEWGSGRPIADSGKVDRLLAGFGTQRGSVTGGWQWTMPSLTDEEAERLYALSLDVGATTTVLVVEDPAPAPALNERVHWGLLTRLEPFARQAPGENKWSMQVQDW